MYAVPSVTVTMQDASTPRDVGPQAHLAGGDGQPLGIYARTYSPPPQKEASGPSLREIRAERYALKSVVNRLLPSERVAKCHRVRLPACRAKVLKDIEHQKAFFSGVQVCASVWGCPVCSSKISERRRVDLGGAIMLARMKGIQVYMLTLTVPHGLGDDLGKILDSIHVAWKKTTQGKIGQTIKKSLGIIGTIKALEVTHGDNGFHPHFHVLLFVKSNEVTCNQIEETYYRHWSRFCVQLGLGEPSREHGVKCGDGSYAAAYASKWGLESEMTKSHLKQGKNSLSPFDFLRRVLAGENRPKYENLFKVYYENFKGRRQLYWSNGLRKLLGLVEEKTDEELAAEIEETAVLVCELTDDQWRLIARTNSQAELLHLAERCPDWIPHYLELLYDANPPP